MKPVIALVGRPNVGKSTLFNCLTRSRDALVADTPGLTRDRQYGDGRSGGREYIVIDTGGLSDEQDELDGLMAQQARQAIEESDRVLWLVDARAGMTAADYTIADFLRRCGKTTSVVVNKTDGLSESEALAEFYALGLGAPVPIAASHGRGVNQLIESVLADWPVDSGAGEEQAPGVRVALVGRPNVGKSTLINRMLGEERVLAYDQPGTTRDSIYVPLERDGDQFTLIDTAGIRRRSRVSEAVEKFSIVKALQAIAEAHVVIVLLDAREGVVEQDISLLGEVLEQGRALVVAINKWDGLPAEQREQVKNDLDRRLGFIAYAEQRFISALHGTGVGDLFDLVLRAYRNATRQLPTPALTELLAQAVTQHQPPLVRGRRIKLRYAHQGGKNPPRIIVHGNQVQRLPDDYKRYLAHFFQKHLKLNGTPVRMEFKSGDNPYKNKRNPLTPRQQYKRKRLKKHIAKGKG